MSDKRDLSVKRVSNKNLIKSENVNIRSSSVGGSPIKTSKSTLSSSSSGSPSGGDGHLTLHLRNRNPAFNQATTDAALPIDAAAVTVAAVNESTHGQPIAIYFMVNFQYVCVFTAILPLLTLFTCFVTAYVFQYDEVHETHCRVYNIVPSISAITGVSPQRYFWRFSIAMHLGPRVPIAFVYKNYYRHMLTKLKHVNTGDQASNANLLVSLILILNCIEIASLGGVTYISNRENYPIHEKIFIIFMICSLCYMLATIKLNDILHKDHTELSQQQRDSIKWKKILFSLSIVSTVGLLIFFAKHRFYCHDLAFSWFAFFEYLIAIANMLFHFTVVWDFPTQYLMVVQAPRTKLNELFSSDSSKSSQKSD